MQGVHLYDTSKRESSTVFAHGAPVLDATFQDDTTVISAGLDGLLKQCVHTSPEGLLPIGKACRHGRTAHLQDSSKLDHFTLLLLLPHTVGWSAAVYW